MSWAGNFRAIEIVYITESDGNYTLIRDMPMDEGDEQRVFTHRVATFSSPAWAAILHARRPESEL